MSAVCDFVGWIVGWIITAVNALARIGERHGLLMVMHPQLEAAFEREMSLGRYAYFTGKLDHSFVHFGRAHILGSHFCFPHMSSHWWMMRVGFVRCDPQEVAIQGLRTLGAAGTRLLAPFFGTTGNSGGAENSVAARYVVPEDLLALLSLQEFTKWEPPAFAVAILSHIWSGEVEKNKGRLAGKAH